MNSRQAKEFRERWQAVEAVEAEERITASIAARWQQTNAILCLAIDLGLPPEEDGVEIEVVRRRWARLKGESS
ncbi:MAG: hypothetical protein U9R15_05455 [Chloroflexota bacterium]|nr:hypothetical protein [Chloroflexota bacterium]